MDIQNIKNIFFVGIGGIGMSALARFFHERGITVSGYDRMPTTLTDTLMNEGISIQFDTETSTINDPVDVVVYTPAISQDNVLLQWFKDKDTPIYKRSDLLQFITENMFTITVAGTHGKTTISTMIAYILRETKYGCNAFLGGIASNYQTNYWGSPNNTAVIEADEYDRSFLKLNPDIAVLTAMSADHLDIYKSTKAIEEAFIAYTERIKPNGTLWYKFGLKKGRLLKADHKKTYSLQNSGAKAYAQNIQINDGGYNFDVRGENWRISGVELNLGGMHNVENCVVAIAVAKELDINSEAIKSAISGFKGIKRRFEYLIKTEKLVYIDDYAHHPEELESLIKSAKVLFPNRRCVVIFQPHLFSRTRDFTKQFARSLDQADEVILMDIYPARELPIEGISSASIAALMGNPKHTILSEEGVLSYVRSAPLDLIITAGAGNIDKLVGPIKEILNNRFGV